MNDQKRAGEPQAGAPDYTRVYLRPQDRCPNCHAAGTHYCYAKVEPLTDTLVARLRFLEWDITDEAADRITALQSENASLKALAGETLIR